MDNLGIVKLTPYEKVISAKISLNKDAPFFSYLIQHMRIQEMPPAMLKRCDTMAVDRKANLYYSSEFVAGLPSSELRGVFCHEVIHVAFQHTTRGDGKNIMINKHSLWNYAIDIVANYVVLSNGFSLPEKCIRPDLHTDSVMFLGVKIEKVSEKSAETIYDELRDALKQQMKKQKKKKGQQQQGQGQPGSDESGDSDNTITVSDPNNELGQGFDRHDFEKKTGQEGEEGTAAQEGEYEPAATNWDEVIKQAHTYAKMQGKEPMGLGREFDILGRSFVPWRAILRREVAKGIPFDYTWSRPSPKLYAHGFYFPATTGEQVTILATLDLSGSVDRQELSAYVTELYGIAKTFPNVTMRILTHDSVVHDDYLVKEANRSKLLNLKFHGGGGTSHVTVHQYIKEKGYAKKYNLVFHLTDGYTDWPDKPAIKTYVLLGGQHCNVKDVPSWAVGVISMDGHY